MESFELVEISEAEHGRFYAGDCYIVLYTYGKDAAAKQHVVYMWQGRDSSTDERGACALKAIEIDSAECQGSGMQIRVPQV